MRNNPFGSAACVWLSGLEAELWGCHACRSVDVTGRSSAPHPSPLHCLGKSSGAVLEGWERLLWRFGSILSIFMSKPVGAALLPGFLEQAPQSDSFFIQALWVLHSASSELSSYEKTFLWCCSCFKYIICGCTVSSHLLNEASYKLEIFPLYIN